MKLINIRPIIVEADNEDDNFAAVTPYSSPAEQLNSLKRKEEATKHEIRRLHSEGNSIARRISGSVDVHLYPGGGVALDRDIAKGLVVRASNDVVVINTPESQPAIQRAIAKYKRYIQLNKIKINVHNQILIAQGAASHHLKSTASDSTTGTQIPEAQVPPQISTGKGKFRNPYFVSDVGRYAGDPEGFPWTAQMQKMYTSLTAALVKRGFTGENGFTVMYASTIVQQAHGTLVNCYNFAVIGAGGRFVWRKYDKGGGSGQNWVYVDGKQMKTSTFLATP